MSAPKSQNHRKQRQVDPQVVVSKALSKVLRHDAVKLGLSIRSDGFVLVDDILNLPKFKSLKVDLPLLRSIVDTNEKKRFTIVSEPSLDPTKPEDLLIRANQGHSIEVAELELTPILSPDDLPLCIHGTYKRFWDSIEKEGLRTMGRNHIHLAVGLPGQEGVISGIRLSCDLFIYINVPLAIQNGIEFFRSNNNVILTEGIMLEPSVQQGKNSQGVLHPKYFEKVVDKRGNNWPPLKE